MSRQEYDYDGEFFATALAAAAFAIKSMDESTITVQRKPQVNASFKDIPLDKTCLIPIGGGETEADKWEKAQMAKIKERYARKRTNILDWEERKKGKVKQKKARTESEIDRRRANMMQYYREKIERIEKFTKRARAQAEKNERIEILKVKEKANKFRKTGKRPYCLFICC